MPGVSRRIVIGLSAKVWASLRILPRLVAAPSAGRLRADDGQGPPLPPRGLLRIGGNALRTPEFIGAIAFSPDGRLIAAGEDLAPSPRATLFDVRTGRQVGQLVTPGRETGSVRSIAFSPDGTRLLWGEMGGEVALWDLSGGRLLFREMLHPEWVKDVAFSPDGTVMASAGGDAVRLRRVARPAEVVRDFGIRPGVPPRDVHPAGDAEPVFHGPDTFASLAFTPDGKRLVAGTSHSARLLVWSLEDGRRLREIPEAHGKAGRRLTGIPALHELAVTPDGRRILSIGQTSVRVERPRLRHGLEVVPVSEVKLWDIETGGRIADHRGEDDEGFSYGTSSRDGRRVAMGDFGRLRIVDAATGRAVRTIELPGQWGSRPAFSPDGALVAMPILNAVTLFEVATGRRLHHDPGTPYGYVHSAAWSPSGDRIVTGHSDGFVRAWDAATGKLIWRKLMAPVIRRNGWSAIPCFVTFSRDGRLVVAAGRRDDPVDGQGGIVGIYEADSGRTVREVVQEEIVSAALSPDDRMLVVAASRGLDGDTRLLGIEVATGRIRWANPPADQQGGFGPVVHLRFEAKSPWFQVALRGGELIRFNALTGREQRRSLADWRTPEQKARNPRPPMMFAAASGADGRTLVTSRMEWIYVWDAATGAMRRKFRNPHDNGSRLALSPDGRTLATSDLLHVHDPGEDTIRLYDVTTGEQVLALDPPDGRASRMAFSPDGTRFFTGFHRSTGMVWDVRHRSGESSP